MWKQVGKLTGSAGKYCIMMMTVAEVMYIMDITYVTNVTYVT